MSARLQYTILIVVGLVGIVFIMWGLLTGNSSFSNILISVGASILATSIVSSVIRITLGDPTETLVAGIKRTQTDLENVLIRNVRIIERSAHTGLQSIWVSRQEETTDAWIDRLRNARSEIKLLAYAMAFLPDHAEFADLLQERLRAGCKICINLGDPMSSEVASREKEENENIVPRIETAINRLKHLVEYENFEFRLHSVPLYCSLYMFDDEMFVTPHLYGVRGAAAPLLLLRRQPRSLFGKYEKHFDQIWRNSRVVEVTSDLTKAAPPCGGAASGSAVPYQGVPVIHLDQAGENGGGEAGIV